MHSAAGGMPPPIMVQSPTVSISQLVTSQSAIQVPSVTISQVFRSPQVASPTIAGAGLANLLSQVLTASGGATNIDPNYLFWVMIVGGNISRCQGCSGKILKPLPPPEDLVLQHKEQVLFQNPNTGCHGSIAMFTTMLECHVCNGNFQHSNLKPTFV
jgi:hypothetical protein